MEIDINVAKVGDKVKFAEEKQRYTIQARNERFIICTKPFNPQKTVLYSIIDLKDNVRGPDNMLFGGGYETREECEENLEGLVSGEYGMEVSYRRRIELNIENISSK
jgi:hypothetical protein